MEINNMFDKTLQSITDYCCFGIANHICNEYACAYCPLCDAKAMINTSKQEYINEKESN